MTDSLPIVGREAFRDALRGAFARAADEGWPSLCLCDPDFAQWPLGERGVIEQLTRWAGANRQLTVLALHFDAIARQHPRWVAWRRQWAHVVACRALQELSAGDVPVLLHAPGWMSLRLLDPLRWHGVASGQPADILKSGELIDAISQRSVEAFPASTLGL